MSKSLFDRLCDLSGEEGEKVSTYARGVLDDHVIAAHSSPVDGQDPDDGSPRHLHRFTTRIPHTGYHIDEQPYAEYRCDCGETKQMPFRSGS